MVVISLHSTSCSNIPIQNVCVCCYLGHIIIYHNNLIVRWFKKIPSGLWIYRQQLARTLASQSCRLPYPSIGWCSALSPLCSKKLMINLFLSVGELSLKYVHVHTHVYAYIYIYTHKFRLHVSITRSNHKNVNMYSHNKSSKKDPFFPACNLLLLYLPLLVLLKYHAKKKPI